MSRVRLYVTCAFGFGFMIIGLIVGLVIRHQVRQGLTRLGSICGEHDKTYKTWADNTGDGDTPKYKHYYAFNATNVASYLGQIPGNTVDLNLDLVGPFSMRQYETKFNVSFSDDSSEVTFESFEHYVFDKSHSCATCDNYDHVVGLNPALLKAMTAAGPEALLALAASAVDTTYAMKRVPVCTQENIQYSLTHPGCNSSAEAQCCCDSTPAAGQIDVTNPANFLKCQVRAGGPSGIYSTFAGFDNGVTFNSPVFLQPVTSPLFLRKNLHEFAFGYPSALFGLLTGLKLRGDTTGQLAKMAAFTQHVLEACSFDVTKETAPKPDELAGKPYQYLGGISCAPIKGVFYWTQQPAPTIPLSRCAVLGGGSITAGCTCVNPQHGDQGMSTSTKPCCTTTGFGCLAPVPGYVTDAYFLSKDHAYLYSAGPTTQNTGCHSKDGQEFWWSKYRGAAATPVFSLRAYRNKVANKRDPYTSPIAEDLRGASQDPANFVPELGYTAPVQGGDGTRFRPTGKTSAAFNRQLSNGYPKDTSVLVYITQVRRAAKLYRSNEETFNKILVNRFEPSQSLLSQNAMANPPDLDTSVVGAGTPFSGVQDVSYISGFNAYVSRPLFLLGDDNALTQKPQDCVGQQCVGISVTREGHRAFANANHTTFLLVEPATGLTLSAHKQLQASFALYNCVAPLCSQGSYANLLSPFIPGGKVIPQYYMDETATATNTQLDKFRAVMSINIAADVIMLTFPLVGATLIGVSLVYWYRKHGRKSDLHTELLQ